MRIPDNVTADRFVELVCEHHLADAEAVAAAMKWLDAHYDFNGILRPLIQAGVADKVHNLRNRQRAAVHADRCETLKGKVPPPKVPASESNKTLANLAGKYLMEIVGGKRLGDCTKEDLLTAASHQGRQAHGCVWKQRYYRQVANRVRGVQLVKEVLNDHHLAKLSRKAQERADDIMGE